MRTTRLQKSQIIPLALVFHEDLREKAPTRSTAKAPPVQRPQFDESLLQLPLFESDELPETLIEDQVAEKIEVHAYVPSLDDDLEAQPWTEEGIAQLHSVLLYESLAALAGRGNGVQKREILEWIFEPSYVDTLVINGVPTHIYTRDVAWTFDFCCRLERMENPDLIRDFIRRQLPEGSAHFH